MIESISLSTLLGVAISLNDTQDKFKSTLKSSVFASWMDFARLYYLLIPNNFSECPDKWISNYPSNRKKIIKNHIKSVLKIDISVLRVLVDNVDEILINTVKKRTELVSRKPILIKLQKICYFCGKKPKGPKEVDHIIPFSRGGGDRISNLSLICKSCNRIKSKMLIGERINFVVDHCINDLNSLNQEASVLKFYVFLRDEFKCSQKKCDKGIHSNVPLYLKKKINSGICCLDNLETICKKCNKNEKIHLSSN